MAIHYSKLNGWVHPADLFVGLFANTENAFWLDRDHNMSNRFSIMGAAKETISDFEKITFESEINSPELPFDYLGGYVGFIDFEGNPQFLVGDRVLVLDHNQQAIYFVGDFETKESFELWHHAALLRIGVSGGEQAMYRRKHSKLVASAASIRHGEKKYLELVQKAKQHIQQGDVYQLCLTNEIKLEVSGDGLRTFIELRESNPTPYAAYLRIGELEVISCSPEQFLRVDSNRTVSSKPIKGTRPRGATAQQDADLISDLQSNEKERAENLMIVDLMRNDFGRVAFGDSIAVPKLFEVESYSSVHQLVSTVTAQLRPEENALSAIKAAFPGGSMTGAPKIRAVELIGELEAGKRGIYSGVLGYLSKSGACDLGMVIRTIVVSGNQVSIGVGGGITIDSDPHAELEETKVKAANLLASLETPNPWG